MLSSGGMPSSHSATVTALAACIGLQDGTGSSSFAIAVVLACVVYIGNFAPAVKEEELRPIFLQFGEIVYVNIPQAKGCGFVHFTRRTFAEEAIQRMHGSQIRQTVVHLPWGKSSASKQVNILT